MKRGRWMPQRSEADRQGLISELQVYRRLGAHVEHQRRIEGVLRQDWEHGWPEGESVPVDPLPLFDLP